MEMTKEAQQHTPAYVQTPTLIDMFQEAPTFVADKPYKAIVLACEGRLMVETQITEYMAAGLATVAQDVHQGQFALIPTHFTNTLRTLITENVASIAPEALLNNHIEVMDILDEKTLKETTIIQGTLGSLEANIYPDPKLQAILAPENMNIPSFVDPIGVEHICKGQVLIRNSVLGVYPYQRHQRPLATDEAFLAHHLLVDTAGNITTLEASPRHQNFATALNATLKSSRAQAKKA